MFTRARSLVIFMVPVSCLMIVLTGVAPARNVVPATAAEVFTHDGAVMKNLAPATEDSLKITVIYDNYVHDSRLTTEWGFAALIEYGGERVLFDTGGDGPTLLGNAALLEINLTRIESVVLSHIHGDHTGGLEGLLDQVVEEVRPTVYLLPSFPTPFKRSTARRTEVVEVNPGQSITDRIFTTGEIRGPVNEQALVIKTNLGLVIVTGCAHPGIVGIVSRAKELFEEEVYLVLGGFHLGGKPRAELESIVADFRRLGVQKASPTHCTGDEAIALFRAEYKGDFIQAGAGRVIVIEP